MVRSALRLAMEYPQHEEAATLGVVGIPRRPAPVDEPLDTAAAQWSHAVRDIHVLLPAPAPPTLRPTERTHAVLKRSTGTREELESKSG